MKSRFLVGFGMMALILLGAFLLTAQGQTTDEGPGPTEQPSAPMEVGQTQPPAPSAATPGQQPPEAQPGGPSGEQAAKTDLGVARISLIHGEVSTQRGDSGDWSAATLNQPVMAGDKISTGDNARVELQLDFANILRLGANSKANIATLTQKDIQIQLSQGLLNYEVSKDSEAEPEIDTPNVSVHPAHHDGVFRIEVQPSGDTLVIVRKGEAQLATPQGSAEIHSGEMATVRGDSTSAQYKISDAPQRDDWDRWNSDRDHLIQNAQSWQHTNRRETGAQDLDTYGQWQNVPDYGDVWVPNEPEGWAPYRDGNWTYEPYYGWTWVGYEPWGWAPYHYGRWFWYGNSWAWWPGPIGVGYNPFWAPAYVSFWGWGWGAGFGWGGFGWLPIGPCDWFHPWWGGFRGRFGVFGHDRFDHDRFGDRGRFGGIGPLHAGNRFSNLNNLHNDHIRGGMSTMSAGHFGTAGARPVAATREQFGGAHMMAGNLPVVPSRSSLSASGRAAAPSTIRGGNSEHFFGVVHSNVAHPQSFQQETSHLQQSMQQNHVAGFQAGSRSLGESAVRRNTGVMQGGRETSTVGARGNSPMTGTSGNRGTMRPFTPPSGSNTRSFGSSNSGVSGPTQRGTTSMPGNTGRDGFRPFTPPTHTESSASGPGGSVRGNSGSYWSRTAPNGMESRRYGAGGYGSGNYGGGRPQLDMHQPVVRGPSNGGYSRTPSYGGGSRGVPSYSGPRGGGGGGHYSAPSGGGGGHYSAPSGGGHPSGGGGGHVGGGGGGGHAGGGGRH